MWSHGYCTQRINTPCDGCAKHRKRLDAQFWEIKNRIKALREDIGRRKTKSQDRNAEDKVEGDTTAGTSPFPTELVKLGTEPESSSPAPNVDERSQSGDTSEVHESEQKEDGTMEVKQGPKFQPLDFP